MTTGLLALLVTIGVGGTPPDTYTMRNSNLDIPIRFNEAKRAEVKEVELHVSTDQGRTWTFVGRAKPDQQAFRFHAQGDGLYWFAVCTVDKNGHRDPEEIASAKPALKVLIDTTHPALQVVAVDRVGEEVQVAWECSDSQADPASLRLEYRPAGEPTAVWTSVPVTQQINGVYRFRPNIGGALAMRMQITDGTGSPATVVRDIPAAAVAVAAAPPPSSSAFGPSQAPAMQQPAAPPSPPPAIQQANSVAPPIPTMSLNPTPPMTAPQPAAPIDVPIAAAPPTPPAQATIDPPPAQPAPAALRPATDTLPRPPIEAPINGAGTVPTPPAEGPTAAAQHVRDRTVAIDFDVERKGPSGVKKVEVYVTQDDGHTWFKYTETLNANPPMQLDLPAKDGMYGFCMVLVSGVGQTEGPPRPDTSPQFRLYVDRTTPLVEMYSPTVDPTQPNTLVLRYRVADANLVRDSVALFWRSRMDQPWQPITSGTRRPAERDDGKEEFYWTITPDVPSNVYLRLIAKDQAGNVGEFITRDPMTVDLNKPVAKFKGVMTTSIRRP
jgi:hypothetical protein